MNKTEIIEAEEVVKPLSHSERSKFAKLEKIVSMGFAQFKPTGDALQKINKLRLYREDYKTWKDYLSERWGIEVRRSYQLMEAASIASELGDVKNISQKLLTEGTVRALGRAPKSKREKILKSVARKTRGRLTAKAVKQEVENHLSKSEAKELDLLKSMKYFKNALHETKTRARIIELEEKAHARKLNHLEIGKNGGTKQKVDAALETAADKLIGAVRKRWPEADRNKTTTVGHMTELFCKLIRETI